MMQPGCRLWVLWKSIVSGVRIDPGWRESPHVSENTKTVNHAYNRQASKISLNTSLIALNAARISGSKWQGIVRPSPDRMISQTLSWSNAVLKMLHENVHMVLGDVTETVQEFKVGPLTIVENISEGGLRFIPMSSIDVKASDIELALILEQKRSLGEKPV